MVTSVGWMLNSRKPITGFGVRRTTRRTTRGRGIVRKTLGAISRSALGFLSNKIADAISGGRIVRRKRVYRSSAGSYKLTGMGRRPRSTLKRRPVRKSTACGYKRRPKSVLGGARRRVYRRRVY